MKLLRLLVACIVSCFILSSSVFSVHFGRGGMYFSGRSASFFIMDHDTRINLRRKPRKWWRCTSFVKDCDDDDDDDNGDCDDDDEKCWYGVPCAGCCCDAQDICSDIDDLCALVVNNSKAINGHEIRIDYIETLTQTIVDNSQWIVDFVPCCDEGGGTCEEVGDICDFIINLSKAIGGHEIRIDHIETLTQTIVDNSQWIVDFVPCCDEGGGTCEEIGDICEFIINLSNSIVNTWELAVDNSTWIVNFVPCCLEPSGICAELGDLCEFVKNLSISVNVLDVRVDYLEECCEQISQQVYQNSEAIVNTWELTVDNSQWIVDFVPCCDEGGGTCEEVGDICEFIINLSNAIYGHEIRIDHIETLTQTIVDNSQWIVDFVPCCDEGGGTCDEVGDICDFIINLSNSIVSHNSQIINNSNSIVNTWELAVDNSTWIVNFVPCCLEPSGICAELGDLCEFVKNLSISVNVLDVRVDYLEECCEQISQQVYQNSEAIVNTWELTVDNSTWIVNFVPCCDSLCDEVGDLCEFVKNLSISIVSNHSQIVNNSNAIVNTWELTVENSDAIVYWSNITFNNSLAIVANSLDLIFQNSVAINANHQSIVHNSNSIVNNYNAIVNNSNAITNLLDDIELIYENSFAIVKLVDCCKQISDQVYSNSEAIVLLVDCCDDDGAAGCNSALINVLITTDIELDRSCHLHPEDKITVEGEVCIEGNGAMVVFSNPDNPQFCLNPGACVTLKNITLKQINSNTFQIPPCATLKIGENVLFELSEDVVFAGGVLELVDVDGAPTVFTVRGMGGVKRLGFATVGCCNTDVIYERDTYREFDPLKTLDLNYHTMLLQNIELLGVEHIKNSQTTIGGELIIGSIGMAGNVAVNIDVSNALGFIVEGIDNEMRFIADNLTMSGRLLFGDWSDNVLLINVAIPELLAQAPVVNFGNDFMFVQSNAGRAGLIFTDNMITVRNLASCSFIVGNHSFLDGNQVTIENNSIKQTSNDFEQGLNIELLTALPNAIEFTEVLCVRSPMILGQPATVTTALHLKRAKERAEIDRVITQRKNKIENERKKQEQEKAAARPAQKTKPKETSTARPSAGPRSRTSQRPPRRSVGDYIDDEEYEDIWLKNILLPESIHTIYNNVAKLGSASGNLIARHATLTDFGINPDRELNLTMEQGVTIEQCDEPVELKVGDVLNVIGKNNKIVVRDTLTINGELRFAPGAQLVISFDETAKDPEMLFTDMTLLELESNVHLEFTGKGSVIFGDGTVIEFKGTVPPGGICKSNCPELIFNSMVNAICDGKMTVKGVGRFEGRNGARVYVAEKGHLIFGEEINDKLTIVFDRLATLRAAGTISMHKASIATLFDRSASLIVEDNALVEINSFNGVASPGTIVDFTFDNDAIFKVEELGRFYIGDNADMRPMPWNHKKGLIRSVGVGGMVGLAPQSTNEQVFIGRMPNHTTLEASALLMGDTASALQIVGAFVHRAPKAIRHNIEFVNEKNNRMLRTRDGRIISLRAKDGVEEDSFGRARVNGFHV